MSNSINRKELEVIAGWTLFSLLLIAFVVPFITMNVWFTSQNPVLQYLLFNLGFISLACATFGVAFSFVFLRKFDIIKAFEGGLALWLSFSFVVDMWQPPYYLSQAGQPLITNTASGIGASVDAMWAWIFNSVIPSLAGMTVFGISMLYMAVYVFVPLATLLFSAFLLSDGQFFKWVGLRGVKG
jgi:hypothetical protein